MRLHNEMYVVYIREGKPVGVYTHLTKAIAAAEELGEDISIRALGLNAEVRL